MVNQVGAPIGQERAGRPGIGAPAARRPVAGDGRLVEERLADPSLRDHLAHGSKIKVPAAIVEDAEQPAGAPRRGNHRVALCGGHRHHLVGDDVLARFQGADREVRMGVVRCCHDDQINIGIGQEVIDGGVGPHAMLRLSARPALRVARDDCAQLHPCARPIR